MGRNKASRSRKREEKAKVQLKGHKAKFLPKGLNVTDTRFKVRKIIVPDQLKIYSTDQLLTKKKLSIQDVLVRLKHHNTTHRRDGLQGLREILSDADQVFFSINLGGITSALAKLVLDAEREVRHDACKTLRVVLLQAAEKVEPFFETLSSYLGCAMTHIQMSIQEDSLLFLDVLLELTPSLTAKSAQNILPCFLDMISRLRSEQKPDRLLSVNLGGKVSAFEWRIRVLQRLQLLLSAMLDNYISSLAVADKTSTATDKEKGEQSFVTLGNRQFIPVNSDRFDQECALSLFTQTGSSPAARLLLKNASDFTTYVDTLVNLLVECWLEVRPDKNAGDKTLSSEASILLYCTFEIMQSLWNYLGLWESNNSSQNLNDWLKEKYLTTISRHFLPDFPYVSRGNDQSISDNGSKSKKNSRSLETISVAVRVNCIFQNLSLCLIVMEASTCCQTATARKIITYIIECLSRKNLTNVESKQLALAVQCVFKKHSMWSKCKVDLRPLTKAMVERCLTQNHWLEQQLATVFLEVIQTDFNKKFQSNTVVEQWLQTLPPMLCRKTVSLQTLQLFSKLARQKNRPFLDALREELPSIIANMSSINGCGEEGHRCLASILYHVQDWNSKAESEWTKQLQSGQVPSIVKQVVSLKCQ